MTEVTLQTLKHSQTGKIHIVELELETLRHCYCSLNRRREPVERTIDLTDEDVCETCVKGFLDDKSDETIESLSDGGDIAQLREAIQG